MEKIARLLRDSIERGKRILVLCHPGADPDAVGSALALADALRQLGGKVGAGACGEISKVSKNVLDKMGLDIETNPSLETDVVVLVDTSSLSQLKELGEEIKQKPVDLIAIDHHRPSEDMEKTAKLSFIDENSTSTDELIFSLNRELGTSLTPETAVLLLAGIITDTGHFRFASPATFGTVNELIKVGASYERAMEALRLPEDASKRIAMFKATQRSELHKIKGRLIATSEVGSFGADAATTLIKVGADVALVGSEEKGKIRLSGRAREEILKETGLHLGELMAELGKIFSGTGGGHAGAASMEGEGRLAEAKEKSLLILQRMLK